MKELFSRCHSEERSDENLQSLPRQGGDTERGVFAIHLTKTEQLRHQPSNFTITREMSQNATPCHKIDLF